MRLDIALPSFHDLQHALLMLKQCYGCKALLPETALLVDCEKCGAQMCGQCECRCACDEVRLVVINSVSDHAYLLDYSTIEN